MLLGRTFDYSMSKVGNNIFPASVRNNPEIRDHHKFYIKYRMIRDAKDVRDILDVSGQLSLQVMAGLVDIKGKGSYVRESSKSGNFVEVLARIYYETVRQNIEHSRFKYLLLIEVSFIIRSILFEYCIKLVN